RLDSADGCGRNARDFESSTSAAPSNQAAILESQTIHMIQQLIGQTLTPKVRLWGAGLMLRIHIDDGWSRRWRRSDKAAGPNKISYRMLARSCERWTFDQQKARKSRAKFDAEIGSELPRGGSGIDSSC
ncbi:MAG TPA: hypothetical protein VIJ67_14780, partial [Pseudolabrys sp.]